MARPLENVSGTHLACRYKRHAWTAPTFYTDDNGNGTVALMSCRDCTAHKEQSLDSRGRIVKTRMIYPRDYLLKGLGSPVAPVDVRREMLTRSTIYRTRTSAEKRRR